jgi:hypothetical protein
LYSIVQDTECFRDQGKVPKNKFNTITGNSLVFNEADPSLLTFFAEGCYPIECGNPLIP